MELDPNELWRRIPPEEKLEILNIAHSQGISSSLILITLASAVAVGLKVSALMWASFLLVPLVFQYSVSKAWRHLRPKLMLEYLAARSAARRYAFAHQGRDLTITFLFRAQLRVLLEDDGVDDMYDERAGRKPDVDVWVALFPDTVVIMSEGVRGAVLEYAHLLDDKLRIEARSPAGEKEYSSRREVAISYHNKKSGEHGECLVTSRYPAALVVFEKKLLQHHEERLKTIGKAKAVEQLAEAELDRFESTGFGY